MIHRDRNLHLLPVTFILLALFFFSLSSLAQGTSSRDLVRVGVIAPLSGPMATIGGAVRNGIEMAREAQPKLFERISFRYADDQFDAKKSVTAYRSLQRTGDAQILLGFGTILAQVIGPMVQHDHVPFINFNFEAEPVVGKSYIIRSTNHIGQYAQALADHLHNSSDAPVTIVRTEATFFNTFVENLKSSLQGGPEISDLAKVNPTDLDFRTILAKLKLSKRYHDAFSGGARPRIGVFLWPDQLVAFFSQARQYDINADYFGTDLCETAATLVPTPNDLVRCLYPDNDATASFREQYHEKFGNEAQLTFAASAYDMTLLLGETVRALPNFSADSFIDEMKQVRGRSGALGSYSFRSTAKAGQFFEYPVVTKQMIGKRGIVFNPPTTK